MIRTAYSKSLKVTLNCSHDADGVETPSRTRQSEAAACDINNIMAKYQKTGLINHFANRSPTYGDFTNGLDYQSSMNKIIEAQQSFAALPSSLRKRFGNDPAAFMDFMANEDNVQEIIELGLAVERKAPEPHTVHVVNMPEGDTPVPPETKPSANKKFFGRSAKPDA